MSDDRAPPDEANRRNGQRRQLPDRRMVTFDWSQPVRVDGGPPVQRRSGRDRRIAADRRVERPTVALPAAAARALVFPGQGSQAVGMGRDLADAFPVARQVLQEVDDALGQNLSDLMAEGPAEELTLTENAQPALMAVSLATIRVLQEQGGLEVADFCRFVAGHSLGEYTALTAAGSFSITDAARILKARGRAMQSAVPVGQGAMAALMGLDLDAAREVAADAAGAAGGDAVCAAANDNAPGQVVISGSVDAVDHAVRLATDRGAKRTVMLPVSAPFHSPLMAPAGEEMARVLESVTIRPPAVPVVSNVTAEAETDPAAIGRLLVAQVTEMVRWRECVMYMRSQGVSSLIEVGPGKVISGLARRIESDLEATSVVTPGDVEALLRTLQGG